jgi:hypothetical protein
MRHCKSAMLLLVQLSRRVDFGTDETTRKCQSTTTEGNCGC